MRALVVASSPAPLPPGFVGTLARASDVVIAADGGTEAARSDGVVPDVIVGDLDSVSADALEWAASRGARLLQYPADKDVTDLDLALGHARDLGADSVVVTGVHGGRADHFLAVFGSLLKARDLAPCLATPRERGQLIDADGVAEASVQGEGAVFSVIALTDTAVVTVSGARWPLHEHELERLGSHGVSNVVVGESATVYVSSGTAVVLSQSAQLGLPED